MIIFARPSDPKSSPKEGAVYGACRDVANARRWILLIGNMDDCILYMETEMEFEFT